MNNENLQMLMDKAGEMAQRNVWGGDAYKINMAILKIDTNNCAAYTRLAKYYKLNDNISEAKNMYLKTLDIDPENWGAINNLNDIEKDQKENEVVEKVKTTGELLKQGQSSMIKGKYKLASKLFARAYSTEPLLMYAVSLGLAYKKMGNFEAIESLYKKLIDNNSGQADIEAINNEFRVLRMNEKVMAE